MYQNAHERGLRYKVLSMKPLNHFSTDMIGVQDLELTLHRNGNQRPQMVLTISLKWFKNNHNPETNA